MPDHRPTPRLRWTTDPVTRQQIFVVPGDSSSNSSVRPMGKTWGMRVSGDTEKLVPHSYRCPVHGVFDLRVPASEVPDEVACPTVIGTLALLSMPPKYVDDYCGLTSLWAGSTCAIGIEPGMVTG
jgi:hypothetical protein